MNNGLHFAVSFVGTKTNISKHGLLILGFLDFSHPATPNTQDCLRTRCCISHFLIRPHIMTFWIPLSGRPYVVKIWTTHVRILPLILRFWIVHFMVIPHIIKFCLMSSPTFCYIMKLCTIRPHGKCWVNPQSTSESNWCRSESNRFEIDAAWIVVNWINLIQLNSIELNWNHIKLVWCDFSQNGFCWEWTVLNSTKLDWFGIDIKSIWCSTEPHRVEFVSNQLNLLFIFEFGWLESTLNRFETDWSELHWIATAGAAVLNRTELESNWNGMLWCAL